MTGRCMCTPCRADELALPGGRRTRAEQWLAANRDPLHLDAALQERYWKKFGSAVLNRATVEFILPRGPLVEVGAGLGYWARELRDAGMEIAATDPDTGTGWPGAETWTKVEKLTAQEALARYPERNMLLVWPDRQGEWPAQALREFRGELILHVGEPPGGCTGTPEMYQEMERNYETVSERPVPRFAGANDRLTVLRRKRE